MTETAKRQTKVEVKNISNKAIYGYNDDVIAPGETYKFPKSVAEMLINRNMVERVSKKNATKRNNTD